MCKVGLDWEPQVVLVPVPWVHEVRDSDLSMFSPVPWTVHNPQYIEAQMSPKGRSQTWADQSKMVSWKRKA